MRHSVCALVMLAACGGNGGDELVVTIDTGTLHGVLQGETRAFLGVPYAAPPVGPLRWKPPQPAAPFDGTREANVVGSQCPQSFSLAGPGGEEDCLFLNVWTPRGALAEDAPVMVWLHGGAFVFGSGGDPYYSGRYLAETYGAIVVTVNYRLGPLGFLAHPALTAEDPAYPSSGNYGVDDQLAALQWVQRNIAAFGGDKARVLLWGESAGGFSTCVHYISPRSADLFAWAISESGLCSSPVTEPTHADAEAIGVALAEQLGCTGAAALDCLRAKTPDEILSATALPPPAQQLPGGPFYAATIPIPTPNIDGFVVPKSLRQAFADGGFPARPLLLGTNHDEGTLFHSVLFAKEVTSETEYRDALARRFGAAKVDAIVAQYPIASYPSAQAALAQITGDAFFVCPARWTARGALAAGAPVFRYTFDELPESAALSGLGTFHSAEIPYVFGNDNFPLATVGTSGLPLAAAMQGYWTRFAATGSPDGGDVAWPGAAGDQVLELHDPVTATSTLPAAPCDFWDAL